MHSLLEEYLSEVAIHLSALPAKRRNEELREMRAHLENAVIVSRELGQSEDEAAQNAVAQFGTPQDLGENVVWAWRRGELSRKKSFLGAAVSTVVLLNLLPFLAVLLYCLVIPVVTWMRDAGHRPDAAVMAFLFLIVDTPTWWLIGAISGRVFPKTAVAGTGCVMAAWIVLRIARSLWFEFVEVPYLMVHGYFHHRSDYRSAEDVVLNLFFDILLALVATLGVWVGSRRRKARTGRLVRG